MCHKLAKKIYLNFAIPNSASFEALFSSSFIFLKTPYFLLPKGAKLA